MQSIILASALAFLALPCAAQFPPAPSGMVTVNSRVNPDVTISFKQTEICERKPGVKSYSGYVHLPESILSDVGSFNINTYFIYFEARHNTSTAPLAIYLAGGAGESSIYAALSSESGPCYVNIDGTDTVNNPWSFNEYANVLYIDQPVQTGYSYTDLVNGTLDLISLTVTPTDFNATNLPAVNATFGYGTFPDQDPSQTVNTTVQAARALWHFAEHWLSSFPGYSTGSNKINIWGNSYGGYWVPETAAQYSKQLKNISSDHPLACRNLTIDSIGITNGCIDIQSAVAGYPDFAYNNTYGVQYGSEALCEDAMNNITKPGGCQDLIGLCRTTAELGDPNFTGNNATVNEICMEAFYYCESNVISSFPELNARDVFDIASPATSPPSGCIFYLPTHQYLNNVTVQASLGVPLNFTYDSNTVPFVFGLNSPSPSTPLSSSTGDPIRQNGLPNIEYLLSIGVKVALIFGDRDYRCPWTGGELTASAAKWSGTDNFTSAGYTEMTGIETPISQGGLPALIRQAGLLSFTRVLGAGHTVSAYAPETVFRIFKRTLTGVDVVSGNEVVTDGYVTGGPKSSLGWRNELPVPAPETCMMEGRFQDWNPWAKVSGVGESD